MHSSLILSFGPLDRLTASIVTSISGLCLLFKLLLLLSSSPLYRLFPPFHWLPFPLLMQFSNALNRLHYILHWPPLFKENYRVFIKYCVFSDFFLNIPNSVFPRCQCVYTHQAGRKPALQQNWQSSEKSQNFKEKTQYLMNTL